MSNGADFDKAEVKGALATCGPEVVFVVGLVTVEQLAVIREEDEVCIKSAGVEPTNVVEVAIPLVANPSLFPGTFT